MFQYDKWLIDYALKHEAEITKDYQKVLNEVANSHAVYKGKPLPFLYYPSVYTEKDVENFETLTKNIFKVINESIDVYMKHPDVRKIWGFSKTLEEMIIIDTPYVANVPMGRFDFFYYPDGHYEFCELNTDGTSAMNEETPLSDILLKTKGMEAFKQGHNLRRFELYNSWVEEVGLIYKDFIELGHEKSERPYVVIMDFMSSGLPYEFQVFQRSFQARGYDCDIVSPERLDYVDGHLFYNNKKIDIIYRRLVTRDMMVAEDELQPLIQGILANKTCIIGSIKSQIVHTKKYFEALHHKSVRQYLSQETLDYIDKHIPYTAALEKNEHFQDYIENKDLYIIKPIDFYASKGVYAGYEHDKATWITMVEEGLKTGYVIQKFCKKSKNLNLYFDQHMKMHVKEVNNITGVFVYNEKMKGIFTRAGFNGVISDLNDGYSLSSIVASKK